MTPEQVGWLGSFFLVTAGVPQVVKVVREGHAKGMSWWYLSFLWLGFFSMAVFTLRSNAALQLILSYCFQLVVFTVIARYKLVPRVP